MDYQKIREEAARHVFSLFRPDRQRRGFICPICGNGSGATGDGVTFIRGTARVHCFKCGFTGDLIDLKARENNCSYRDSAGVLAMLFNLADERDKQYVDQNLLNHGIFIINEDYQGSSENLSQNFFADRIEEEPLEDQTEFFTDAEKNLEMTDYHLKRGLSWKTAHQFRLGFVKDWRHPKIPNAPESPRLIIPTSKYSYLARDVTKNLNERDKKYSKQKVGSAQIFNLSALNSELVFIVEGEFDAMSFYEVGFNAIALGSISNYRKFLDILLQRTPQLESFLPTIFVLALDNDKGGRSTTRTLHQLLTNFGFFNYIAKNIYGEHKDANEALVSGREIFSDTVKKIAQDARQKFINTFFEGAFDHDSD